MKVLIQKKIQRDIERISDSGVLESFYEFISSLQADSRIIDMPQIKKIHGGKNHFRYRIRDYRVGFRIENKTIYIERILHRKDIYKVFP